MTQNQDNSTDKTLADGAQLTPADGGAAVDTLSLSELNSILGKDFKDKTSALKSVKETYSYVGKRKEDIAAELAASKTDENNRIAALENEVRSSQKENFFASNPQYKDYRGLIEKLGGSPADVVNSAEFKTVFEKAQEADKVATRSVAPSNARLAVSSTVKDEAIKTANARGSTNEDVAMILARGITAEVAGN